MKLVSIIVPAYNEEESVRPFYECMKGVMEQLSDYDFELLFVNDGSTDNTQTIVEQLAQEDSRVAFLELSRNFGKESAMLAGFDYVKGDCAIVIDVDLQHPPHVIVEMISYWQQGYEDVYAKRITRGKESWLRRWLTMKFYRLLDRSTRFNVLQNVGDFRLLDRKCIDALKGLRENERYTKGLFSWIGFRKKEVPFHQDDRKYGKSHWSMMQLTGLAIEGITSFTTSPLRLATIIGFLTGFGAIAYLLFTLVKVLIWGDPVAGYPTLICVILFLGSIQLICIGILGEYIGRIFIESKRRPNYLVRNYYSSIK